jgi:hypothetical protein
LNKECAYQYQFVIFFDYIKELLKFNRQKIMKISITKTPPSMKEMAEILEQQFSGQYSYELFGLWNDKSIIIRKSTFVGAQISKRENEFTIEGTSPSITTSIISILAPLFAGVAAPGSHLWALFFRSPWRKLETEIGIFLKHKYN